MQQTIGESGYSKLLKAIELIWEATKGDRLIPDIQTIDEAWISMRFILNEAIRLQVHPETLVQLAEKQP